MAQIVKGSDMFKDFYRTTFSFLKPLLLLLGLLLPFSLCIAGEYISISDDWDERARNQWDEIARNHKTYYFENGLDHFNQGQYQQAFEDFKKAQEYSIGLGSVYLAKMYLEGKGVKVDYKKAQLFILKMVWIILIKANTSKPLKILKRCKNTALGLAVFI